MNDTLFQEKLHKFLVDLYAIGGNVSTIARHPYAIIGSASLAVHGLVDYIPKDINIVLSAQDMRAMCVYLGIPIPEQSLSEDGRLSFQTVTAPTADGVTSVTLASDLRFLNPHGVFEQIDIQSLRTELVVTKDFRFRNILTPGAYMALAGMFNRPKDRERLKQLYELQLSREDSGRVAEPTA